MSIKIIKNTMVEPVTVECENCKSIISYTYDDIQREKRYNILGWYERVERYIVCPVCKANVDIDIGARVVLKDGVKKNENR